MRVLERLQLGFHSHFGTLFLIVAFFFIAFALIYFVLLWRKKKRDHLFALHRAYYEKMEEILAPYLFDAHHSVDFFGRRSILNKIWSCLIAPPDLSTPLTHDRWHLFLNQESQLVHPFFAKQVRWYKDQPNIPMISLQSGLFDDQGRQLSSFRHYILENGLSLSKKEKLLLNLGAALDQLHALKTENGRSLYHGFLLPSSLFVKEEAFLLIGDTGVAFALGPQVLCQQLEKLHQGSLPMDRYRVKEMIEESMMLAPEQKDVSKVHLVGPASDFYTFGALAVSLLTAKRFSSKEQVDWARLPVSWQIFLKRCLSLDIKERPNTFKELEWILNEPEFALTHKNHLLNERKEENELHLESMLALMENLLKKDVKSEEDDKSFVRGKTALSQNNFSLAKKHFNDHLLKEPDNAYGHAYLGIAYYEMGQCVESAKEYEKAKGLNPKAAREYREYLAFRI